MASTSNEFPDRGILLDQFCTVTGSDRSKGEKMMEICNWNLEMAINMHCDSDYPINGIDQEPFPAVAKAPDEPMSEVSEENVRSPIPPSRAVLVDNDYSAHIDFRGRRRRARSVFDGLRDFQAEAKWQEELQSKPLDPSISKKRKTLEDLFRPPLDLIYRGSFESAREHGKTSKKWLMVNVQDSQEFACQVLNRDVWSNQAVKSIVTEHFVFWQVYCDSVEGQRYMQFYNPVMFPYIAVIDPRTGEKVIVWNKIDSLSFCEVVMAFLNEHSVKDGTNPESDGTNLVNTSEEHQIKAAIEASLKEVHVEDIDEDDNSELETFDSDSESQHSKINYKTEDSQTKMNIENWRLYLGSKDDEETNLVLRLPDGKREFVTWPCSTKIKALWLFSESLGFHRNKYELVTNFPRKNLSEVPFTKTLRELDLYPREMIFVQLKDASL